MGEWMNGYNFFREGKQFSGELIEIKYESKTMKLLDHTEEYPHVLRGQNLLNKTSKSLNKNVLSCT